MNGISKGGLGSTKLGNIKKQVKHIQNRFRVPLSASSPKMSPTLRDLVKKLVKIHVTITLRKKVFKCRLESMLLKISPQIRL